MPQKQVIRNSVKLNLILLTLDSELGKFKWTHDPKILPSSDEMP